jgi:HEAT repeat protein
VDREERDHDDREDQHEDERDKPDSAPRRCFTGGVLDDLNTVATRAREVVLAGYDGADDVLVAARADADATVRARAVSADARRGRRSVTDRVDALRDAAVEVRRRACQLEARTPRRSVRVEAALVQCLADPDPLVVVSAAEALGEVRSKASVAALASTARGHDDARCREAAIAALGGIGEPDGLEAVLGGLEDKPAVRRRAVVALAGFDGPEVEASLARAVEDRDWQVREVAQALLAVDGDERSA